MPRLSFFLYFFLISTAVFSQKVTLKGKVMDSLQQPLSYANVIAKPLDKAKSIQFAITDAEGYYALRFIKGDTVNIEISYVGFKSIEYSFIANKNATKNFIMKASTEYLDEVIIEMPVVVKGDTVVYKTDKFITGEERKLKNVLNKLPGVEVDKNGRVTVNGKKVTKMLVDGKKFFGGNSKLAVNNIPADAVGNVEVIDNYNEIAFLKNLTDSDDLAMNIQLKEDKKRFVFGDIEAGQGNDNFHKVHSNLFYYAPKVNMNFIGNINSIGERTFTFRDYINFQGGINSVFRSNFNWQGGDLSQFLQNQDVLESTQKFAALNITKTASDKLDVSGFLILNDVDNESLILTQNDYTTFREEKEDRQAINNLFTIGKLILTYTPRANERIISRSELKTTQNSNITNIRSTVNSIQNNINTDLDQELFDFNQNIEWHKNQSENHTFSGLLNFRRNTQDGFTFWRTQDQILTGLIPAILGQNSLVLEQLTEVNSNSLDLKVKHFWEINYANHIYTTIGNNYLSDTFISQSSQLLDDGSQYNFSNSGFGNRNTLKVNDFFAGIHYKFKIDKLIVKQGAELHRLSWNTSQSAEINTSKWVLLPDFYLKYDFNKAKKIQFNYGMKTSFSRASQMSNQFVLRSYNSVFRGNENLENSLFHSARFTFSRFSFYRGLVFFFTADYLKHFNEVRNTVNFSNQNQFLSNRMFRDPFEEVRFSANLEKKINLIRYNFNINTSFSEYLQEINGVLDRNRDNNYSFTLGLETIFRKFPNIEAGITRNIGEFITDSYNRFVTTEPYLKVNYDFLDGFVFSFDYTFFNYQNYALNQENNYELANFSLLYQKTDSPWIFKVIGNNIFDTEFIQNNTFSQYLISDKRTFVLPRVVMLSIGYDL